MRTREESLSPKSWDHFVPFCPFFSLLQHQKDIRTVATYTPQPVPLNIPNHPFQSAAACLPQEMEEEKKNKYKSFNFRGEFH